MFNRIVISRVGKNHSFLVRIRHYNMKPLLASLAIFPFLCVETDELLWDVARLYHLQSALFHQKMLDSFFDVMQFARFYGRKWFWTSRLNVS